ncbi:putative transposase [Macrophomina phaseolina MS6]|uniref:Putative transposase n=1 Tax=Macrophomina phaseolina (strain MS6) TaxID=1126212 RepID=K2RWZ7_MACPH|nr:putative transposase [Macrophomina phaseolina MS6]
MDALLSHYEKAKIQYSQPDQYNAQMLRSIEMGWFVLDKYYSKTDEAPVYAAALLLDPRKRAAYIRKNWPSDWHEPSIIAANTIWEENYNTDLIKDLPTNLEASPPPPEERPNKLDVLFKDLDVKPTSQAESDDFDTFINAHPIKLPKDCTPLQWWC